MRLVDLDARFLHETEKARRFEFENATVWVPKSQHEWDEDNNIVTMPEAIAQEKGLI